MSKEKVVKEKFGNPMDSHKNCDLKELYRKTYKMALFCLRDVEDAEDLVQEVFLKVTRHKGDFRGDAQFSTWVWRICNNTIANYLRRKKLLKFISLDILFKQELVGLSGADEENPEILFLNKENRDRNHKAYERALNTFTPKERRAFFLYYYENMSYKEIASIMESSLSSIESLLVKGRRKLKKLLG